MIKHSLPATNPWPVLLAIILLAVVRASALERRVLFISKRQYNDIQSYQKFLGESFVRSNAHEVVFYGKGGSVNRRLPLKKDRLGYSRHILHRLPLTPSTVVVRSTRGYEAGEDWFEFYSEAGVKIGEAKAPTLTYRISPVGDIIAAANPSPHSPVLYESAVSIIPTDGRMPRNFELPFAPLVPRFVFADSGRVGAVIFNDAGIPKVQGHIVLFSTNGQIITSLRVPGWLPIPTTLDPLAVGPSVPTARIDDTNRLVIASGFDQDANTRAILAADFSGRLSWKVALPLTKRDCLNSTEIILKSRRRTTVIMDFCLGKVQLAEIDLDSGTILRRKEIPHHLNAAKVTASVSPSGQETLLTINSDQERGQDRASALLLGSDFEILWEERSALRLSGKFAHDGSVVLMRGTKVDVGRFEKNP
jgi:hypothetical protein